MTATRSTPDVRTGEDRLFTAPFVLLALGELAYFVADGMAVYLVPVHATGPLGSDAAGAGLAFGAFAVSALLLRPVAGRLCDARGRRPLLIGGAGIATVVLLLTASVDSLGELLVLRLCAGVAEAAVFVAAFAAVADLSPAGRLGEAISYNSLALYLGLAAGPPLAEILVERAPFGHGYAVAWCGAAALAATATAGFAAVGETRPSAAAAGGVRAPLIHRGSLPVALAFLASIVAMGGFLAFAGLRATGVGLRDASLPLVLYGSIVVVGRVAFAKVPDRLPPLPLGAAALGAIAAGLGVMASWATPAGLLAGTAVLAVGVTFSTPAFFTAAFTGVPDSERGAASATLSATIDIGLGAGPIVLGLVAQDAGMARALCVGAVVALLGAAWSLRQWRDDHRGDPV